MNDKQYNDYRYIPSDDYDKTVKVNDDDVRAYSKKKLKDLYPDEDYTLIGETYEDKKKDKEHDVGRIELNEKRLFLSEPGKNGALFRKQAAFIRVTDGKQSSNRATFVAFLKLRLLPFILLGILVLGLIAGGICLAVFSKTTIDPNQNDPHITPVDPEVLVVSGMVTQNEDGKVKGIENAELSLQSGNVEIAHATTDQDGKYLIANVKNGNYNLVCTKGESVLTKIATVSNQSIVVNFRFPAKDLSDVGDITEHDNPEDLPPVGPTDHDSDVKAVVKITDDKTPAVSVGGLDKEAMLNMVVGKEVDFTLFATLLDEDKVPSADKAAILADSGELELTFYDFSVLKEVYLDKVLESKTAVYRTKTVLEIAIPYDSSRSVDTRVFRAGGEETTELVKLTEKPSEKYVDGTYYVTASTVYIYTNNFNTTYAVGAANADQTVHGSDVITYRDSATINLKTGEIEMLYKHDGDSTNDARVDIYLVGDTDNMLVSESGIIPVGYQLEKMILLDGIAGKLSVGSYKGLMRIIYLGGEGTQTDTKVEIPLGVIITR